MGGGGLGGVLELNFIHQEKKKKKEKKKEHLVLLDQQQRCSVIAGEGFISIVSCACRSHTLIMTVKDVWMDARMGGLVHKLESKDCVYVDRKVFFLICYTVLFL